MDFRSNLNILPDNDSPSRMAPLSHLPSVLSFDKPSCPTTHISANARFNSVIDSQCRRMLSPHPCFYNRTPRLSPHPNPRNNRKLTAIFTHHLPAKFTFRADPLQKALRGTLVSKVNFTGWANPCQKCFSGRLSRLVKFTFQTDPLQNAFWGRLAFEVERPCVHLEALPPLQCPQRHIGLEGEFHRSRLPLPEVPQRPIGQTREIHLSSRPHPEGPLGHVVLLGEFHRFEQPLSEVLQRPIHQSRQNINKGCKILQPLSNQPIPGGVFSLASPFGEAHLLRIHCLAGSDGNHLVDVINTATAA